MKNNYWRLIGVVALFSVALVAIYTLGTNTNTVQTAGILNDNVEIVIHQLEQVNGAIPVELDCNTSNISAESKKEQIPCRLINNTEKNIRAAYLIYSLDYDRDGSKVTESRTQLFETYIHQDLYISEKSIKAKTVKSFSVNTSFHKNLNYNQIVNRLEIEIDYIDFEDETSLGVNKKGKKIISNLREGAMIFSNWLKRSNFSSLNTKNEILEFLSKDKPISPELKLDDKFMIQGAKAYRNRLRQKYLIDEIKLTDY